MNRCWRYAASGLWFATAVLAQGCAEPRDNRPSPIAAGDCSSRVVVGFATAADAGVVAAVAQSAAVRLIVVNQLLPDLYVLDLSTTGPDSACVAALARVRGDARVRSADLDTRRGPNAG